jgi:hypothetical protein
MDTLMLEPMETDHLSTARSAYWRRDWRASYTAFVRADAVGPLALDDLDAFATAAWLVGHGREAARLAERVYDRSVRTDPAAAAMKAAVLSMMWRTRGHEGIASDWAAKARRLLTGAPTSPVRGYLVYVEAVSAVDLNDADTLAQCRRTLDQIGRDVDPGVAVLAGVLGGVAALIDGRVDEGCRLLDGALTPVLGPQVPHEWGGDVYRLALRVGAEHGAGEHVRIWLDSMGQWCDSVDSAAYRAIYEVHLLRLDGSSSDARRAAELRRELVDLDAVAVQLLDELQGRGAQ